MADKEGIAEGFRVVINNGPDACKLSFFFRLSLLIPIIFFGKLQKASLLENCRSTLVFLLFAEISSPFESLDPAPI